MKGGIMDGMELTPSSQASSPPLRGGGGLSTGTRSGGPSTFSSPNNRSYNQPSSSPNKEPPPYASRSGGNDPTPYSAAASIRQYTDKIRQQAGDLIELQEQLEEAVQYGKLCESRINQLQPGHPLPITQAMVQDYLPPPPTVDEPSSMGPQATSPLKTKDMPAHILSIKAKHRKEQGESATIIAKLKKQVASLQSKLDESARQSKSLRTTAETREREARTSKKMAQGLQEEVDRLKAKLNDVGVKADFNTAKVKEEKADEISSLRQLLRAEEGTNTELRARIRVLEDALELHAEQLIGIKGQAELLAEVARLRGENAAFIQDMRALKSDMVGTEKEQQRLRAENTSLKSRVSKDSRRISDLEKEIEKRDSIDVHKVQQLESEKNALLDYIEDTVDRTAHLSKQVKEMADARGNLEVMESALRSQASKASDVQSSLKQLQLDLKERDSTLELARFQLEEMRENLQEKTEELEEARRVQADMEEQLRSSRRSGEDNDRELRESLTKVRDLEERNRRMAEELSAREKSIVELEDYLDKARAKLIEIEPEYKKAQIQNENLLRRCDHLTTMLGEKRHLEIEVEQLRALKAAVQVLDKDLVVEPSTEGPMSLGINAAAVVGADGDQPTTPTLSLEELRLSNLGSLREEMGGGGALQRLPRAHRHSAWVTSAALRSLSSRLASKVRQLYTDLTLCETELAETSHQLDLEKREYQVEREQLSEKASTIQKQLEGATFAKKKALEENRALRRDAEENNRNAEVLQDLLRITLRLESGGSPSLRPRIAKSDLPKVMSNLIQERDSLRDRLSKVETQFLEARTTKESLSRRCEALELEQSTTQQTLGELRRRAEAEEELLRGEALAMRVELEKAAELAERQNALTMTLEGKLDSVMSEKHVLEKQVGSLQSEVTEAKARLLEEVNSLLPLLKTVIRSMASSTLSEAGALLMEARRSASLVDVARACRRVLYVVGILLKDQRFLDFYCSQDGNTSRSMYINTTTSPRFMPEAVGPSSYLGSSTSSRRDRQPIIPCDTDEQRRHVPVPTPQVMREEDLDSVLEEGRESDSESLAYRRNLMQIQQKYRDLKLRRSGASPFITTQPSSHDNRSRPLSPTSSTSSHKQVRSTTPLSPGALKLQERLRAVQNTFASLRSSRP